MDKQRWPLYLIIGVVAVLVLGGIAIGVAWSWGHQPPEAPIYPGLVERYTAPIGDYGLQSVYLTPASFEEVANWYLDEFSRYDTTREINGVEEPDPACNWFFDESGANTQARKCDREAPGFFSSRSVIVSVFRGDEESGGQSMVEVLRYWE